MVSSGGCSGGARPLFGTGRASGTYALRHWNGNVFSMRPSGEGSDGGPSAVTFTPPAGTGTMSMTIEYLNENGLGTFGKQ